MTADSPRWTFTAPLWRWTAKQESADPGAWSFVTLPVEVGEDLRDSLVEPPAGFGSVRVAAEVGGVRWTTSVFPDKASGSYVLPVKKAVRARAGLEEGDPVTVTLDLGHGR